MEDSHDDDNHDNPDSSRLYRRFEPFDNLQHHHHNHHHQQNTAAGKDGSSRAWPSKKGAMIVSRRLARRIERWCCLGAHYFPLAFVYGLSSWAAWVMVQLGRRVASGNGGGLAAATWLGGSGYTALVLALWAMQLWSYSTAVFTAPGSTTDDQGYSTVPTTAASAAVSAAASSSAMPAVALTVKSNGELRFCKKCQARKPDRAHHCSTCRRCVLKMDHHCPWLATCVGLRNAKAFVLFLVYTTLFALACLAASAAWVWAEVAAQDGATIAYDDSVLPIQIIVLCVVSGIIGLVVGLFTCWHLYLACRGQTTIECMEKTRYQSPLRRRAAALASSQRRHRHRRLPDVEQGLGLGPAADDDDDGDDDDDDSNRHFNDTDYHSSSNSNSNSNASSAPQLGRRLTYDQLERYRAQKRHQEYLDEQDSKLLPHAFDLGVRLNLLHLLGPRPWLWALPICNTTGDGWSWKPSPRWLAARDRIQRERDEQRARERAAGWGPVEEEEEGADDDDDSSSAFVHYGSHPASAYPTPPPRYGSRPSPRQQASAAASSSPSSSSSSAAPASARFSTSKADRILGRDPRQYSDEKPRPPASASAPSNARASFSSPPSQQQQQQQQPASAVSMQRLSAAGRALRRGQLPRILDDSILHELDDDDEEERRQRAKDEAAAAQAAAARRLQHQQTHLALAPLRARWLPQQSSPGASGASGLLLRKPAIVGPRSAGVTSPLGSPGSVSGSGHGFDSGPASPLLETVSLASRADTDDGGVD